MMRMIFALIGAQAADVGGGGGYNAAAASAEDNLVQDTTTVFSMRRDNALVPIGDVIEVRPASQANADTTFGGAWMQTKPLEDSAQVPLPTLPAETLPPAGDFLRVLSTAGNPVAFIPVPAGATPAAAAATVAALKTAIEAATGLPRAQQALVSADGAMLADDESLGADQTHVTLVQLQRGPGRYTKPRTLRNVPNVVNVLNGRYFDAVQEHLQGDVDAKAHEVIAHGTVPDTGAAGGARGHSVNYVVINPGPIARHANVYFVVQRSTATRQIRLLVLAATHINHSSGCYGGPQPKPRFDGDAEFFDNVLQYSNTSYALGNADLSALSAQEREMMDKLRSLSRDQMRRAMGF